MFSLSSFRIRIKLSYLIIWHKKIANNNFIKKNSYNSTVKILRKVVVMFWQLSDCAIDYYWIGTVWITERFSDTKSRLDFLLNPTKTVKNADLSQQFYYVQLSTKYWSKFKFYLSGKIFFLVIVERLS